MKNLSFALITATVATFVIAATAYAAQCQPIYGGGQTCVQSGNVVINKEVQKPGTNGYVDNLTVNDPKWAPEQTFNFRITVTNTGGSTLSKVTVKDFLPSEVSFVAGPFTLKDGAYTADILNLQANQSQTLVLTVKANALPNNEMQRCEINNKAIAIVDGQVEDNARFCIAKVEVTTQPAVPGQTKGGLKVFPPAQVKTTPSTGPEAFALIGLIPSALTGFILRRRAGK
jgi:uncharacterized repeat protein (TIGR01451 family)